MRDHKCRDCAIRMEAGRGGKWIHLAHYSVESRLLTKQTPEEWLPAFGRPEQIFHWNNYKYPSDGGQTTTLNRAFPSVINGNRDERCMVRLSNGRAEATIVLSAWKCVAAVREYGSEGEGKEKVPRKWS